jgi:hypothetical protein
MKLFIFLLSCLTVIGLVACGGPSQAELDAQATTVAANIFATQTAEAPTNTPTPPPTDTPAPTNTPAPTDTPTPAPTDTPVPPATPEPTGQATAGAEADTSGASTVVLLLEDLPSGFEEVNPVDMGLTKETMNSANFKVESIFTFLQPKTFEIVLGFTSLLPTKLEQVGFDAGLRDPEFLSKSVIGGMAGAEIVEQEDLALDDIGDKSAGLTIVSNMEGIAMRMNIVIFRKSTVGAFVTTMHIDKAETTVSVEDLARALADKIE